MRTIATKTVFPAVVVLTALSTTGCFEADQSVADAGRQAAKRTKIATEPSKDATNERKSAMKETSGSLSTRVLTFNYDASCELLSIAVEIRNVSKQPVFVIANKFAFVRGRPGTPAHELNVLRNEDDWTFDLSHLMLTQSGYESHSSELGSLGFVDKVIEIDANSLWNLTYVFQFPLNMDRTVSNVRDLSAPRGKANIRLRFGWSNERYAAFSKRVFRPEYTIKQWDKKVGTEWQKTTTTEPIVIDFPR